MINSRRNFLVGSVTASFVAAVPAVAHNISFEADMKNIISESLAKMPDAEVYYDWINYFEEVTELYMKKWGTYKPLAQMKMAAYVDRATGQQVPERYVNMWYNPNFVDECNMLGMGTDGFGVSFKHPYEDKLVECVYSHAKNTITVDYGDLKS